MLMGAPNGEPQEYARNIREAVKSLEPQTGNHKNM